MKQLWLLWLFGGFVWTTNRQPRLPRCPELYRDMPCMYGYIRIYSPMSRNCISFSKILSPIVVQQWLTHRGSKISNRGSRISNPRPSKWISKKNSQSPCLKYFYKRNYFCHRLSIEPHYPYKKPFNNLNASIRLMDKNTKR